jgi:hypothetical protein
MRSAPERVVPGWGYLPMRTLPPRRASITAVRGVTWLELPDGLLFGATCWFEGAADSLPPGCVGGGGTAVAAGDGVGAGVVWITAG